MATQIKISEACLIRIPDLDQMQSAEEAKEVMKIWIRASLVLLEDKDLADKLMQMQDRTKIKTLMIHKCLK